MHKWKNEKMKNEEKKLNIFCKILKKEKKEKI
jgi:hypothetical protein